MHKWRVYRRYFNLFIYLSVGFLVYFLYRFDYLALKALSPTWWMLVGSLALLCMAVSWGAFVWGLFLWSNGIRISMSRAIASHGLSVFAKYVPGKVWTVLGRATYVAAQGFPLSEASFLSFEAQIINVCIGLMFGLLPMVILGSIRSPGITVVSLVFVLVMGMLVFSGKVQRRVLFVLRKVTRRQFPLPDLNRRSLMKIIFYYVILWIIYSSGYYIFIRSFWDGALIVTGLIFPLSMNLGLLAFIIPGGLVVREGVMTGYLVLMGLPAKEAAVVSLAARLWFTVGEVFLFGLAMILDRRAGNVQSSSGL